MMVLKEFRRGDGRQPVTSCRLGEHGDVKGLMSGDPKVLILNQFTQSWRAPTGGFRPRAAFTDPAENNHKFAVSFGDSLLAARPGADRASELASSGGRLPVNGDQR
ncbi:hypothetical protein ABIA30_001281 [Mycobacterium sp. MAA66]|uniref:hypothetical protein n=1 Tax=Mycobacterium sp. MAA66 TaxID=3156297 RepID=UPI003517842E